MFHLRGVHTSIQPKTVIVLLQQNIMPAITSKTFVFETSFEGKQKRLTLESLPFIINFRTKPNSSGF